MSQLTEAIQKACDSTPPYTKAREKALAGVRWALKSDDGYLVLGKSVIFDAPRFVASVKDATIYDGRDNEEMKRRYFEALTGKSLIVELA